MDKGYPSTFNQVFGYAVILDHSIVRQNVVKRFVEGHFPNYVCDTIIERESALQFLVRGISVPNIVFVSPELLDLLLSYPMGGKFELQKIRGLMYLRHKIKQITLTLVDSSLDLNNKEHHLQVLSVFSSEAEEGRRRA